MNMKLRKSLSVLLLACLLLAPLNALVEAPFFKPVNELERRRQALYGFLDSAFGAEYNNDGRNFMLRWTKPITISLEGEYTPEDEAFFTDFLAQLNSQVTAYGGSAFPGITRVDKDAGIRVVYTKEAQMKDYMSFYEPDNWGLFEYYYNDYALYKGTVTIATDVTQPAQRNHLLMEEIVGALGLTNDIYTYSDSIVYQPWTEVQKLSDMDWLMLAYLYSPNTRQGMSSVDAYGALLPSLTE